MINYDGGSWSDLLFRWEGTVIKSTWQKVVACLTDMGMDHLKSAAQAYWAKHEISDPIELYEQHCDAFMAELGMDNLAKMRFRARLNMCQAVEINIGAAAPACSATPQSSLEGGLSAAQPDWRNLSTLVAATTATPDLALGTKLQLVGSSA